MTGIIDLFNLPPQREQRRYFRARSQIQRRKDRSQKPEQMRFWGRRDCLGCLGLRFGLFISIFVYFETLLMPFQREARAGQSTTQCTRCYHLQTSAVCQSLAIFSFFWTLIDGADLMTTSMKISFLSLQFQLQYQNCVQEVEIWKHHSLILWPPQFITNKYLNLRMKLSYLAKNCLLRKYSL